MCVYVNDVFICIYLYDAYISIFEEFQRMVENKELF